MDDKYGDKSGDIRDEGTKEEKFQTPSKSGVESGSGDEDCENRDGSDPAFHILIFK